jgi:hypothetical protein
LVPFVVRSDICQKFRLIISQLSIARQVKVMLKGEKPFWDRMQAPGPVGAVGKQIL